MSTIKHTFISQEEYLQLERSASIKSEYFNGQIIEMTSLNVTVSESKSGIIHEVIQKKLASLVNEHLTDTGNGVVYPGEQRVFVADKNFYTYPDLVVSSEHPQFTDALGDTLVNPQIIAEVLSPGSANYDRGSKFENYRSLESLQEYLVVDARRVYAELWRKDENNHWCLQQQAEHGSDMLHLKSIDLYVLIDDVYDQIEGLPEEEFTIR